MQVVAKNQKIPRIWNINKLKNHAVRVQLCMNAIYLSSPGKNPTEPFRSSKSFTIFYHSNKSYIVTKE